MKGYIVAWNRCRVGDVDCWNFLLTGKQIEETMQAARPYQATDNLKQFLDHDRHVLRFYCYWDDRENMFGEVRYMVRGGARVQTTTLPQ